jgi:hypothetical protein
MHLAFQKKGQKPCKSTLSLCRQSQNFGEKSLESHVGQSMMAPAKKQTHTRFPI